MLNWNGDNFLLVRCLNKLTYNIKLIRVKYKPIKWVRDVKKELKELKKILAAQNYKLTSQREQILEILLANEGEHLSAEDIYNSNFYYCSDVNSTSIQCFHTRTCSSWGEYSLCCQAVDRKAHTTGQQNTYGFRQIH